MTAPVDHDPAGADEIDVGRDRRLPRPWESWSRATRRAVAVLVVVVALAAGAVWFVVRESAPAPEPAAPVEAGAPGADVVVDLGPDTERCPAGATCRYEASVDPVVDAAFREAFGSAGYIGRQTVADAGDGTVYWDLVRFSTGTLVTVSLSQQPVSLVPGPTVESDTPTRTELANGSFTLTAVRDGYLMTVSAAGLPGQALPVRSAQEWLRTVPAPS